MTKDDLDYAVAWLRAGHRSCTAADCPSIRVAEMLESLSRYLAAAKERIVELESRLQAYERDAIEFAEFMRVKP